MNFFRKITLLVAGSFLIFFHLGYSGIGDTPNSTGGFGQGNPVTPAVPDNSNPNPIGGLGSGTGDPMPLNGPPPPPPDPIPLDDWAWVIIAAGAFLGGWKMLRDRKKVSAEITD